MKIPLSEREKSLFLNLAGAITDDLNMIKQLRRKEMGMTLCGKETREVLKFLSWPSAYIKKHGLDEGDAGEVKLGFNLIVCHSREMPSAAHSCFHSLSPICNVLGNINNINGSHLMPAKMTKWVQALHRLRSTSRTLRSSPDSQTVATLGLASTEGFLQRHQVSI